MILDTPMVNGTYHLSCRIRTEARVKEEKKVSQSPTRMTTTQVTIKVSKASQKTSDILFEMILGSSGEMMATTNQTIKIHPHRVHGTPAPNGSPIVGDKVVGLINLQAKAKVQLAVALILAATVSGTQLQEILPVQELPTVHSYGRLTF